MSSTNLQYILSNELEPQLNREIIAKYKFDKLTGDKLVDVIGDVLFGKLELDKLPEVVGKRFTLPKDKSDNLVADIIGMKMLPLNDYYKGAPRAWLMDHKIDTAQYQKYVDQSRAVIEAERKREYDEEHPTPDVIEPEKIEYVPSDPVQEKKDAVEIFKSGLVDFLTAEDEMIVEMIYDYNLILIELLDQDKSLSKKLEQALYDNQETLTTGRLTIDGKAVEPTIGNWLKDFISRQGALFFDNVVLSEYVTNSPNARKLSEADRKLLIKLLTMYRTIKFFPATLNQIPPEQWQVIPFEMPEEEKERLPEKAQVIAEAPVAQTMPNINPSDPAFAPLSFGAAQWKTLTPIEKRTLAEEYQLTEEMIRQLES